jgi:hypothetical protein
MEEELIDLGSTLYEIYKRNLVFLEEHFPKIFDKLEKLSKELEKEE